MPRSVLRTATITAFAALSLAGMAQGESLGMSKGFGLDSGASSFGSAPAANAWDLSAPAGLSPSSVCLEACVMDIGAVGEDEDLGSAIDWDAGSSNAGSSSDWVILQDDDAVVAAAPIGAIVTLEPGSWVCEDELCQLGGSSDRDRNRRLGRGDARAVVTGLVRSDRELPPAVNLLPMAPSRPGKGMLNLPPKPGLGTIAGQRR